MISYNESESSSWHTSTKIALNDWFARLGDVILKQGVSWLMREDIFLVVCIPECWAAIVSDSHPEKSTAVLAGLDSSEGDKHLIDIDKSLRSRDTLSMSGKVLHCCKMT